MISINDIRITTESDSISEVKRISRSAYDSLRRMNPSTLVHGIRGMSLDPYAVKHSFENSEESRTAASQDRLDRGTLAHMMILEPHTVEHRVAIWKGKVRSGNEWTAFADENRDKLIIRSSDFAEVQEGAMIASSVSEVREILSGCEIEAGLIWPEKSIKCKGLVDAVSGTSPLGLTRIPDLKTTARIDEQSAIRTIQSLYYRQKMAMYRRAISVIRGVPTDTIRCFNIFVQLDPPYGVNVMQLGSDGLDWAEKQILNLLGEVERCMDSGIWKPLVMQTAFGMTSWEQFEQDELNFEETAE